MSAEVDALIVGAGPVGLTMAAELTRHGLRCRIVDRSATPSDKSKALVLWSRTLELLAGAGAVEPFLATGMRVTSAGLYRGPERLVGLSFADLPTPYPFALMIPQSETERLLAVHLQQLGVAVERGCELLDFRADAGGVTARLRNQRAPEEQLRAAWLIGCDGAHSAVRHGLGIEFAGAAEPNDWLLADVHIDGDLPPEVRIYFHGAGVLALFPISSGHFRIVADCGPAAPTEHPHDPTLAETQAVVDTRGPGNLRLHDPLWLTGFRINERKVADYRAGRVFLAGDAAHIHSPAGGQGMNTGMQDAFNLGWKLGLVHAGQAQRDVLLDSYSRERSAIGDQVLRNSGALTRVATLRNPTAQHLRNAFLPFLGSLGVVQARLRETLSELDIHYRSGRLSCDERGRTARARAPVVAGDRAPDAALLDPATGRATRLFEGLGTHHCLLLCAGDADAVECRALFDDIAAAVPRAYGAPIDVFVVAAAGTAGAIRFLLDRDRSLQRAYGVRGPTAVLIRPDGYIGYIGEPPDRARLLAYLGSYLNPVGARVGG